MILLKQLEKINELRDEIKNNQNMFPSCVEIYLFGSFLKKNNPNDIDMLVIYDDFDCGVVINQIDKLVELIESVSDCPVDMTALTRAEMKEIAFLNRLNKNYIKVI